MPVRKAFMKAEVVSNTFRATEIPMVSATLDDISSVDCAKVVIT